MGNFHSFSGHFSLKNSLEGIRNELVAISLVELVLEFNPMESEGVQEAFHGIHAHEYKECECEEN